MYIYFVTFNSQLILLTTFLYLFLTNVYMLFKKLLNIMFR